MTIQEWRPQELPGIGKLDKRHGADYLEIDAFGTQPSRQQIDQQVKRQSRAEASKHANQHAARKQRRQHRGLRSVTQSDPIETVNSERAKQVGQDIHLPAPRYHHALENTHVVRAAEILEVVDGEEMNVGRVVPLV